MKPLFTFIVATILIMLGMVSCNSSQEERIHLLLNTLYNNTQWQRDDAWKKDPNYYGKGLKMTNDEAEKELLMYGSVVLDSLHNRIYNFDIEKCITETSSWEDEIHIRHFNDAVYRQIGGYYLMAKLYSDVEKVKLLEYQGEDALRKRAVVFYSIDGGIEGAAEIAKIIASKIDYNNDTRVDITLLLGLLAKSLPSERDDILQILKKCIDDKYLKLADYAKEVKFGHRVFYTDSLGNEPSLSIDILAVLDWLYEKRYDGRTSNFLFHTTKDKLKFESLLFYLYFIKGNSQASSILNRHYSSDIYFQQLEQRSNTAIKQGISPNSLFYPDTIDNDPVFASNIRTGGTKPKGDKVLILSRNDNSANKTNFIRRVDIPELISADKYAVSDKETDIIILIDYDWRHIASYSGGRDGAKGYLCVANVYAINAKDGRAYTSYGPFYGPDLPQRIVAESTPKVVDYYSAKPIQEISRVINNILK